MTWRHLMPAALAAGLLPLAGCASTPAAGAPIGAVPPGDCALYAAGLDLMPKVTSLSPVAGGISPTRPQDLLGGDSMQQAAGFALPPKRLADASLRACDLGQGRAVADTGLDVTRIAYARDGAAAVFLFDMPFNTRDAIILDRGPDGSWRAREHKILLTYDPPMRVSREDLLATGATDIRSALATLPLILIEPPPARPAARPPSGRPWP